MAERICVPQAGCAGIDVGGVRYRAHNGVMTVDNPDHAAAMRANGECFPAYEPIAAGGFVCRDCGFHAVFRVCGRCGGTCERPSG